MTSAPRESLIPLLIETGMTRELIEAELIKLGESPITDAEVIMYGVPPHAGAKAEKPKASKTTPDGEDLDSKAYKGKSKDVTAPVAAFNVAGLAFTLQGKYANPSSNIPVVAHGCEVAYNVMGMLSGMLHEAFGPVWYAAYKNIKNPGHSTPTEETRRDAAAFIMASLLAMKAPVDALKPS